MSAVPHDRRKPMGAILAVHPGNSCAVQCARSQAALSRFSPITFEAKRHLDGYNPPGCLLQQCKAGESIKTTWSQIDTELEHLQRVGVLCAGNRGCAMNIASSVHLTDKDRTRLYVCARQMQTILGASA